MIGSMSSGHGESRFWKDLRDDLSDDAFRTSYEEAWREVTGEDYAAAITEWEDTGEASAGTPRDERAQRARELQQLGRNDMDGRIVTEEEVREITRQGESD